MAHWAKINDQNIVEQVASTPNGLPDEGLEFISSTIPGTWLKTSYNTMGNKHLLGGTPFRKNYASPGFYYDETLDAFIPPKPEGDGWELDDETCLWQNPSMGIFNEWDDSARRWFAVVSNSES